MLCKIHKLPVLLTSFAYRDEYFSELEGMLETIRKHHSDWHVVVGRGPIGDCKDASFEVKTSTGQLVWTLPVTLPLDGSANDWRRITLMKGWWLSEVWHYLRMAGAPAIQRVLWLDADGRLNRPLDFYLEPDCELVAGPWWIGRRGMSDDAELDYYETITTGMFLLQGQQGGAVEKLLDSWKDACLSRIVDLPKPTVDWLDGDQELLTDVMAEFLLYYPKMNVLKLRYEDYCCESPVDASVSPNAVVDQWMMSRKMKFPEDRHIAWPPPEKQRRHSQGHFND